jgi:hypothetical protein
MLHHAAVLALLSAAAAAQSPILAHWLFDETTGTTAMDSGPLGNTGTLTNFTTTAWVPGQFGNALQFDGVDDYVLIATPTQLPVYDALGTPFSIAFWVKAPAQSDRRVYSEQAAAPSNSGPLFTLGSGSGSTVANATALLRVYIRTDDVIAVVNELSNGVVFDDTWHHVAYTDVSGRAQIWIDGVLDRAFDYSHFTYGPRSAARGSYAQLNSITLGAVVRNLAIAAPLMGMIDDLRIYRTALSAADVQAIMANGLPSFCTASLGEYGYGCGQGPLDMAATGSAGFGNTLYVQLFRGQPGAVTFMCIGAGVLQPRDLTPLGYRGCTLYQPTITCTLFGTLGPAGSSPPYSITIPNVPALACSLFGFQGVALTPTSVEFAPVALAQLGN